MNSRQRRRLRRDPLPLATILKRFLEETDLTGCDYTSIPRGAHKYVGAFTQEGTGFTGLYDIESMRLFVKRHIPA